MHEVVDGRRRGRGATGAEEIWDGDYAGRFNPADGQLYVCGLVGGVRIVRTRGILSREVCGRPLRIPVEMHVGRRGCDYVAEKLDRASAEDVGGMGCRGGIIVDGELWIEALSGFGAGEGGVDEVNVWGSVVI